MSGPVLWVTLQALVWAFGLRAALELRREVGRETTTWTAFVWAVTSCLVMDLAMLAQALTLLPAFSLISVGTGIAAAVLMGITVRGLLADLRAGSARRSRLAWDRFGWAGLLTLGALATLIDNPTRLVALAHPLEGALWLIVSAGGGLALVTTRHLDEHKALYRPYVLAVAFGASFFHASLTPVAWLTGWQWPDGLGPLASTVFILTVVTSLYGTLLRVRGQRLAHTERRLREAQEQMFAVEKLVAVGTLAAGAAHDFNNALTVISGSAQLALENDALQGQARHDVEEVVRAASDAARIPRDLMALARRQTTASQASLVDAVRSPLDALTHDLAKRRISVETRFVDIGPTNIDGSVISQVCLNLYLNARDAMMATDGGRLTVVVDRQDDTIAIAVSDTGTGIPAWFVPKVFQPLQTTKGDKGTGLGLAGSRAMVEALGGRMSFETEEGRGTTFRLHLPAQAPQMARLAG